ncbi:hypothetical protein FXV91_16870 [Methanosarcina sp. DH2]|uniref:hypothetical protein n=1 Tax=Methanosarcina sp. DH2 TaxID=2605639 RepID=UPI001E5EFA8A|nr:hypothetical protein [Methanosarcina sp. DH2]MCC4771777.1 hypothetical protein [Methanosarcina sp. DH2]
MGGQKNRIRTSGYFEKPLWSEHRSCRSTHIGNPLFRQMGLSEYGHFTARL